MNQFQGNSHKAAVVKCKSDINEIADSAKTKSSIPADIKIHSNSKKRKTEVKVLVSMIYGRNEQRSIPSSSSSVNSTIIDIQSPTLNMELGSKIRPGMKKLEQTTLSNEEQEEIFDKTDENVDVHNKITINMRPSRRSPLISPRTATASQLHWRSPIPSPISSHHGSPLSSKPHSPALRSPISTYVQSPLSKPCI